MKETLTKKRVDFSTWHTSKSRDAEKDGINKKGAGGGSGVKRKDAQGRPKDHNVQSLESSAHAAESGRTRAHAEHRQVCAGKH